MKKKQEIGRMRKKATEGKEGIMKDLKKNKEDEKES
jgi:hypothetical protein